MFGKNQSLSESYTLAGTSGGQGTVNVPIIRGPDGKTRTLSPDIVETIARSGAFRNDPRHGACSEAHPQISPHARTDGYDYL